MKKIEAKLKRRNRKGGHGKKKLEKPEKIEMRRPFDPEYDLGPNHFPAAVIPR